MSAVTDADLFAHASRAAGKVVLITGGGNGIGRQAALDFARHGAKVVIGDVQTDDAAKVVEEIVRGGGEAVFQLCDVTNWEQQHALFQLATRTYGTVDIVVPNAGIGEHPGFRDTLNASEPTKPVLRTLEINLTGVFYTLQLALIHFGHKKQDWNKAIIFIGSMAGIMGIPSGYQYSASKHAIIGLAGSLYDQCTTDEIRLAVIAPWFTDTAIVHAGVRLLLAGVPFARISRVSGAIFAAATNPDPKTNAAIWSIPDHGEVFRLERPHLSEGPYKILNERCARVFGTVGWLRQTVRTTSDILDLFGTKMLAFAVAIAFGAAIWNGTWAS
ncbi:NAD(P)-binding protein [Auricularia subglabra TFB-10046 SS5]|nr:NAD(P)-binding protein [Auricularia subglabra TFB-10046 SS5]